MSREREEARTAIIEALIRRPLTCMDLAEMLGMDRRHVTKVVQRMRAAGIPLEMVDSVRAGGSTRGAFAPVWRISYPAGRTCSAAGCGTILRRTNPSDRCEVHGGGFVEDAGDKKALPLITCSECGEETDDYYQSNKHWKICRPCYLRWRKEWREKRREKAKVQP